MTGLFDGVAGILGDVFGDIVEYRRKGDAGWWPVQSTFRQAPISTTDSNGLEVLIIAPTWRVIRARVPDVKMDDQIRVGGVIYRVVNVHPTGSPAQDAQVLCELEEWDA
ncbi:head-tail joining protein [Ketogulonicigenium vulgare]|uniref:head-tail joining protein n=1 Tax=Ketogulonicigenium vulgare TaxID=92945 RepID=UPI002359AA37|nr:hypothetical protein [Ketogulonicigenium vulgare]